jgi:hypothetical protein
MDIDKWTAEKVGKDVVAEWVADNTTEIRNGSGWGVIEQIFPEWTMQDARCREIVREHFDIYTMGGAVEKWAAVAYGEGGNTGRNGKTIEEAEIACIKAIMEAE